MNVIKIPIGSVEVNDYNPNKIPSGKMKVLKTFIEKFGFLQPILVRKDLNEEGKYIVVDGEHRFTILKQLGATEVPAIVFSSQDQSKEEVLAKMQTINMNRLRGEFDMVDLADVIVELRRSYSDEELVELLGFEQSELEVFDKMLGIDETKLRFSDEKMEKELDEIAQQADQDMRSFDLSCNKVEEDIVKTALDIIGGKKEDAIEQLVVGYLND